MSDAGPSTWSKWLFRAVLALGLFGLLAEGLLARNAPLVQPGTLAPGFRMDRLGGGEVGLAELQGKVVMLDFWATWCPPCREEMPVLVKLAREYESRGLVFLAASRDDPDDAKVKVALYADQNLPELAPFATFAGDELADAYQVQALPTLYFISRDGKVSTAHRGQVSEASLRSQIEAALSAP